MWSKTLDSPAGDVFYNTPFNTGTLTINPVGSSTATYVTAATLTMK